MEKVSLLWQFPLAVPVLKGSPLLAIITPIPLVVLQGTLSLQRGAQASVKWLYRIRVYWEVDCVSTVRVLVTVLLKGSFSGPVHV